VPDLLPPCFWPPSSAISKLPSCICRTATGRPQTSLLVRDTIQPVTKSRGLQRLTNSGKRHEGDLIAVALRAIPGAVTCHESPARVFRRKLTASIERKVEERDVRGRDHIRHNRFLDEVRALRMNTWVFMRAGVCVRPAVKSTLLIGDMSDAPAGFGATFGSLSEGGCVGRRQLYVADCHHQLTGRRQQDCRDSGRANHELAPVIGNRTPT
jgi:hypothetical protein